MKITVKVFAAISLLSLGGCGVGIIYYEPKNGGPPSGPAKDFKAVDIDCQDGFEKDTSFLANLNGGQTAMGAEAGTYTVACTQDGKPMTGKVVGVFHAAPLAAGKWDQYRGEVTAKARNQGCPTVAVRKSPPTKNQEGEAIGAFCLQP